MKVSVVGTGYVGLVTGTCFAEAGNDVTCVDIDEQKVKQMVAGKIPIYEPGLEPIFKRNIREKRLKFTTDLEEGIKDAAVIFLALPTPPGENGSADLSYVLGISEQLGKILKGYMVVVNKSTVPVGTAEKVTATIAKNAKFEFDVVSNPEFLREGHAVEDFQKPDRVVVGTSSKKAEKIMKELYGPFVRQGNPILIMDTRSSELTKYAANSFLATKISFMNEIANLCELTGANIDNIRVGIGSDDRIGRQFLYAGIGYGGSCFPKDVMALEQTSTEFGYDFGILKAVSKVNKGQKERLVEKVKKYYSNKLDGKVFALWGLAFKPDTDDIREAPALEIIKKLVELGASIVAFDPEAAENVKRTLGANSKVKYASDRYEALKGADALLIATEWSEFRSANFTTIKSLLKTPVIFDGRNLYDLKQMATEGFHYESIGRPGVISKVSNG